VGEEAVEVVIAGALQGRERTISESADLLYHLFVLLVKQDIRLEEVEAELERRHAKAGRP
jgi:phosphoribosyl-ATP pyrophosphohydrolase